MFHAKAVYVLIIIILYLSFYPHSKIHSDENKHKVSLIHELHRTQTNSPPYLNNNLPFSVFFYTSHIPQNAEFSNQN